jgi:hypothetical protein
METTPADRCVRVTARNDGGASTVPRHPRAGHQSHHGRRESRGSGDGDRRREELIVHAASVLQPGGGMMVVVIPLIALRRDMKRRCDELGLRCHEWGNRQPGDGAQIVLVTPESVVGQGFRTFLNRMRATQQLERIVIDECHVVLNDQMDFRKRKQLQQLGELSGVGV